jgi:hydroxypyruvate isomerase
MSLHFALAACVETLWQDKPIHWRAHRLKEMGFGVGLWNWPDYDLCGFMIGGTAGRTTLYGEGLQHEDGHSLVLANTIPNCISYDLWL